MSRRSLRLDMCPTPNVLQIDASFRCVSDLNLGDYFQVDHLGV